MIFSRTLLLATAVVGTAFLQGAQAAAPAPVDLVPGGVAAPQPQVEVERLPGEQDSYVVEMKDEAPEAEVVAIPDAPEQYPELDDSEFVAQARAHCAAFLASGDANLLFALAKSTAVKFSAAERAEFNRRFGQKIIAQYGIDTSKPCALDAISLKQLRKQTHAPKDKSRYALPEPKHEIAVVSGQLASAGSNAPVSVSYRLERKGGSPWFITNISFNGQPLVDRYREEYRQVAEREGVEALLSSL